jgi:hypothetical protein
VEVVAHELASPLRWRRLAGKTYCQADSRADRGDFREKAPGRVTSTQPQARSRWCRRCRRSRCSPSSGMRELAIIVTRSLPPFPRRMRISRVARSRSFTRSCSASSTRRAAAVQHKCHEPGEAGEPREHSAHLVPGEHHRETTDSLRPRDLPHRYIAPQHVTIEKEQRAQCLGQAPAAQLLPLSELAQESLDVRRTQLGRMTHAVITDEPLDPGGIGSSVQWLYCRSRTARRTCAISLGA